MTLDSDSLSKNLPNESFWTSHDSRLVSSLVRIQDSSFDGLEDLDLDLYSLQNHHRVRRKEQFSH